MHRTGRGIESECAPAREHDRVNGLNGVDGIEQIGLTRPGRGAANIDSGDRSILGQNHGTAGWSSRVSEVSDLNTGYICNRVRFERGNRTPWRFAMRGFISSIADAVAENRNAGCGNCAA
jgi:hypothetical protein